MSKSLVISFLLCFTFVLKSQVTVHGAKRLLTEFEKSTLNIVGVYLRVIKNELPFNTIVFLKEDNFMNHLKLNEYYLVNLNANVNGDYGYLRSWSSLIVFKATKRITNVINKNKDLNYTTIRACLEFPIEIKKFGLDQTSETDVLSNTSIVDRYNFGVLKNNMQQVVNACEKGKDIVFIKDYSDKKKLSILKQDTLFIVQNNPIRNYLPDMFKNFYPYKYKFISHDSLEDLLLNSTKDFYYLHFDYSSRSMTNQISIVNSLSGDQIFHDQSITVNLLSERMLKMLVKKIEAK
jgi:hypothetical protein